MSKKTSPQSLTHLLGDNKTRLNLMSVKSGLLIKYNEYLVNFVLESAGLNLLNYAQVSNYRDGMLVIETFSPAVATRLKYIKPNLLDAFKTDHIPTLKSIEIKIVPKEALQPKEKEILPTKAFSKSAGDSLRAAAEHMPESLKEKLENLASLANKK